MKVSQYSEFGRLVPLYVWVTSFVAVFSLLLFSRFFVAQHAPAFQHVAWLISGVVLGALVVIILAQFRVKFWGYRILDPLPRSWDAAAWLLVSIVVAIGITLFDAMVNKDRWDHVLKDHGSLFDWFIGSLTIVGIWLTYNTIVEAQRIIRSFSQLYERIIELVKDTKKSGFDGDLHFLAYTASIGFLALDERLWNQLRGELTTISDRLKMICLDDEDLTAWHNHYVGRSTWRRPAKSAGTLTLKDTLDATRQSRKLTDDAGESKRLKSELMPGFYLIFNSRRAIIVAPFFIPPHPLTPLSMEIPKTQAVQMFGFETTDSRIIEDVSRLFAYYWDSRTSEEARCFESQAAAAGNRPEELIKQVEDWLADPAKAGKCFRLRLFAVEEEPWKKILSFLSTAFSKEDYSRYLATTTAYALEKKLVIIAESADHKAWIDSHCRAQIEEARLALRLNLTIETVVGPWAPPAIAYTVASGAH